MSRALADASTLLEVQTDTVSTPVVTGPQFRRTLDELVPGVSWKATPLRTVLRQVSQGYRVAILCDRRIDPTVTITHTAANKPLREILSELAHAGEAELRLVGNGAYLGPADSAAVVRTLGELRKQELLAVTDRSLAFRRLALQRGQTVRWSDLTEPREILRLIGSRFDLSVEDQDLVPHDLWAGAILPEMTASEMLTLVLIQFDLTFAWGEDFTSIRLTRLPKDRSTLLLERIYSPRGSAGEAIAAWQELAGPLDVRVKGPRVVVRGTLEQHEAISEASSAKAGPRAAASDPPEVVPLSHRTFSLTVARVPASAIMARLEESGIDFEYDAAALDAAGIDLQTPVSLDVKQVDAATFFEAVFGPLGGVCEIDGATVRLRPAD